MPPFRKPGITLPCTRKQQGAALMVMLVIMIIGAATILVSSLASSAIKIERDKTTANALAQAKEALIGRALADSNRPGSLPCPDTDDDGSAESLAGNECPNYTGRLPWRTLRLPDLRDGSGERLWYALSQNFHDDNSIHINSDTQGTLTIGGTNPAGNVIAIVFAPGQVLNGTSRSPSTTATCSSLKNSPNVAQSWCATNYLEESNAALNVSAVPAVPNLNYQSADTSPTFNDRMILITHKDLMPLVEKRIAREVRSCLDGFASAPSNAGKYPWAAPVSDTTNYAGTTNTLFGRLPTNASIYNANVQLLLDDIAALQIALNNYSANPNNATIRQAFIDAGAKLYNDANNISPNNNPAPPLTSDDIAKAKDTGDKAQPPHTPALTASNATVQAYLSDFQLTEINLTLTNFAESGVTPGGWPLNCTLFSPSNKYWVDWKKLVFYQIAAGYAPDGGVNCGTSCLTITGSGNTVAGSGTYRAAVVIAGEILSGTRTPSSITNYLEGAQANRTNPPSSTIFDTYKTFEANYPTDNDLVLCLDGSVNCK